MREKLEGVKAVLDGVGSSSLSSSVVGIGGGAGTGNRTMGRSRFVTYNNKPNYQTITNGNTNGLGRSIGLGMTPRKGNGPRLMGQVNELWGALEEVKRTRPKRVKPQEKEPWMDSEAAMEDIAWVSQRTVFFFSSAASRSPFLFFFHFHVHTEADETLPSYAGSERNAKGYEFHEDSES